MAVEIIDLFVFDGVEHSTDDSRADLERDARVIIRKLASAPVAITLKTTNERQSNKPEYEEIFDTIIKSGNYFITVECQTLNFVKVEKSQCKYNPSLLGDRLFHQNDQREYCV